MWLDTLSEEQLMRYAIIQGGSYAIGILLIILGVIMDKFTNKTGWSSDTIIKRFSIFWHDKFIIAGWVIVFISFVVNFASVMST